MRDALSLLDQAVAFGDGEVSGESADAMLGTIDRDYVIRLLDGLAAGDGSALLSEVAAFDEYTPDYATVLDDLMGELQRMAVIQLVGYDETREEHERLQALAAAMPAEDVQLYYQIALQGRRDLETSRDARSSFEMTLLRMLAFRPEFPKPVEYNARMTALGPIGPPGSVLRTRRRWLNRRCRPCRPPHRTKGRWQCAPPTRAQIPSSPFSRLQATGKLS